MQLEEYCALDGLALAQLIRSGQVSPEEVLDTAFAAIDAYNPTLNAVIRRMDEQARAQLKQPLASTPFAGVPILLKDLLSAYAGVPLTAGSRFFADFVPDHDAEIVRRFKRGGLIAIGRTNTPELGLLPVTEPAMFGPTRNPWDLNRTPGGSSGGSGAAVAVGIVPIASGGDGGGSIRIPASCCGLVGLKPTRGRNPTGPDVGDIWHGAVCEHVLTRSVRDTAAVLDAVAGADPGAPYSAHPPQRPFLDEVGRDPGRLRIAFSKTPPLLTHLHPDCVAGLERTVQRLSELGHEVEEAQPPIDSVAFLNAFITMITCETAAEIRAGACLTGRTPRRRDFESETWALYRLGNIHSAPDLSLALRTLHGIARRIGAFMSNYDVLLTPTLGQPPLPIGALGNRGLEALGVYLLNRLPIGRLAKRLDILAAIGQKIFEFVPFTPTANVTGEPSLSLPLHWNDDGLPIGMLFTAKQHDEAILLRLAAQLESAYPWRDRRPKLHVLTGSECSKK